MTIHFYLNRRSNKFNEQALQCYITIKRKRIVLSLGETINPKYWNTLKEIAKPNYIGSPELNNSINEKKEEILKKAREFKELNPNGDLFEYLKKEYKSNNLSNKQNMSFFDIYENFINARTGILGVSIVKRYRVLKNHLIKFEKVKKYKVDFDSINKHFFELLNQYFVINCKLSNNTSSKLFDVLKTFLNWCYDSEIIADKKFLNLIKKSKAKQTDVDITFLTENELFQIYNTTFNQRLESVKDIFLISCFTGQRYSDVSNISKNDIDLENNVWHLRTVKTKDKIDVPLNIYSKSIIEKYLKNNMQFSRISNQKFNKYLKELGEQAGINTITDLVKYSGSEKKIISEPKYNLISSHTGRRTFVILSLQKGMRAETVMRVTAHKSLAVFQRYVKIADETVKDELFSAWNNSGENER